MDHLSKLSLLLTLVSQNFSVPLFFSSVSTNSPSMADPMAAVLSDMMVRVWGTGDYWREERHTGGYIDWAHARPACTLSWLLSSPH